MELDVHSLYTMLAKTCVFCVFILLPLIENAFCFVKESQSYGVGKLVYCNHKYLSLCSVETTPRVVNGVERLFTNHSFMSHAPFGNNFTVAGVFISQKGTRYKVEHKLCDYLHQAWMKMYLRSINYKWLCPVPPKSALFVVLELPPPAVPVPMLPGTYHLEGELFATVSKERVLGILYTLHFSDNYRRNRKNTTRKG